MWNILYNSMEYFVLIIKEECYKNHLHTNDLNIVVIIEREIIHFVYVNIIFNWLKMQFAS